MEKIDDRLIFENQDELDEYFRIEKIRAFNDYQDQLRDATLRHKGALLDIALKEKTSVIKTKITSPA